MYTIELLKQIWESGKEYERTSGSSITFEELLEKKNVVPITQKEMDLFTSLLSEYLESFNLSCDDLHNNLWGSWTKKEKQDFIKEYHKYNGDPQEYNPDFLSIHRSSVLWLINQKLKNIRPNQYLEKDDFNPDDIKEGNYIFDRGGKLLKVDFIEKNSGSIKYCQRTFFDNMELHPLTEDKEYIKPVPLDILYLRRLGKETSKNNYLIKCNKSDFNWLFVVDVINDNFYIRQYASNDKHQIKYVHELQNFIHNLTNIML